MPVDQKHNTPLTPRDGARLWTEIAVTADGEIAEAVSEVFNRYAGEPVGTSGAVLEVTGFDAQGELTDPQVIVRTYVPPGPQAAQVVQRVVQALWHLQVIYHFDEPQVREVHEEDWANAWKAHYHPMRIGSGLLVVPGWLQAEPEPGRVIVRLDPGMAFGTGTHPSTRLCLLALQEVLPYAGRVLDVGTGSGILAIAALKLGAVEVVATDIDPLALRVAAENAAANEVAGRLQLLETSLPPLVNAATGQPNRFDVVIANILAGVIVELAQAGLPALLAARGQAILSGILNTQVEDVSAALAAHGLVVTRRLAEGDWSALIAQLAPG